MDRVQHVADDAEGMRRLLEAVSQIQRRDALALREAACAAAGPVTATDVRTGAHGARS